MLHNVYHLICGNVTMPIPERVVEGMQGVSKTIAPLLHFNIRRTTKSKRLFKGLSSVWHISKNKVFGIFMLWLYYVPLEDFLCRYKYLWSFMLDTHNEFFFTQNCIWTSYSVTSALPPVYDPLVHYLTGDPIKLNG